MAAASIVAMAKYKALGKLFHAIGADYVSLRVRIAVGFWTVARRAVRNRHGPIEQGNGFVISDMLHCNMFVSCRIMLMEGR